MNIDVDLSKSSLITSYLPKFCDFGANNSRLLAREMDLKALGHIKGRFHSLIQINIQMNFLFNQIQYTFKVIQVLITQLFIIFLFFHLASNKQPHIATDQPVRCNALNNAIQTFNGFLISKPCQCHLHICVPWYPCALKYCKGKDSSSGKLINYRCGIRTCRKCRIFRYPVKQKSSCPWDID